MQQSTKSDHLLMSLVERVLARPKEDRQAYLQSACGSDNPELFSRVWTYVQAEERMGGFLLDPFDPPVEGDAPFEPGQLVLNRFRIIREIARGGMGIVWEAMDEKMDLRVAIKCAKAGFGKQLPPEVRNARDISHPNVCNIFEIHTARGPQGEFDFISMEFLEGETLSDRLRRAPLSNKESLAIALQLCAGLAEAHRNNVVHGDLKSNNVILTAEPDGSLQAVIMDFGLARRQSAPGRISPTEVLAGTPTYMAPELWDGVKPSVASDIYALGVVLWELVSGRKPGDVGTVSTLPLNVRGAWKLPAWQGRWHRIIVHCLEENPARRFQDADEVARALGPPRSRRWFLTAAAAAVLAIASGVVTYQRTTAPPESVRLALLPFTSSNGDSSVSENLLRGTASRLARLKSSAHTKFTFIPVDKIRSVRGPTHVLQGTLEQRSGEVKVHAYLTDVRSGVNAKEWTADYKPQEMRYAPGALAGVVTGALHLPLVEAATVNSAARADYLAGVSALGSNRGVDTALASFQRAVTADPDSPLTYAGLAEAQWSKYVIDGNKAWRDHLMDSVRFAQKRNPDLPQVHRVAGVLEAEAGLYDQAIAEYLRAIELDPRNADVYRRLGKAYKGNNQLAEALASFRKAIEVGPQDYKTHSDLGSFYYQQGNYDEASKYYGAAVALAPKEHSLHYALATVELDLGHLDAAESELRTSISLHETSKALHALGLVLMYKEMDGQAIPLFTKALHLGSERYQWWMELGTAYRRVGRPLDAKRAYRCGLDLAETAAINNPRDALVLAGVAYLSAQLGDRRRAEFEIAQALQQSSNDAKLSFLTAITYEALGRRQKTLDVLASSPPGVIADVSRWPDVADLHKDSRFLQLLGSHSGK
jgi:eukaryotic-like serine/threonine-protein kinase